MSVINTKYVVNQIPALVQLALDLGARSFHLASLIPQPIDVENQLTLLGSTRADATTKGRPTERNL